MGGLRKKIPLVYWCFVIGGGALAAVPFLTAGFFSKDEILWEAYAGGHTNFLIAGLVGAFLTSIYTFRMIFLVFHGEEKTHAHAIGGVSYSLPLIVLLVLSTGVGALIHPPLAEVLPMSAGEHGGEMKWKIELLSGFIALLGIAIAAALYLGERRVVNAIAASAPGKLLSSWWRNAWGFDWLYDWVFTKPYVAISELNKRDICDLAVMLVPRITRSGHDLMVVTENGSVRWYVASMGIGAVLVLAAAFIV